MARKQRRRRDYKAEYRRRLARALAKGLSKTKARGHRKAHERPLRPARKPTTLEDAKLQMGLRNLRSEKSFAKAAKAAQISIVGSSSAARPGTIRGIVRAIQLLDGQARQDGSSREEFVRDMQARIERSSLKETASRLGIDPSNLRKMLQGQRPLPRTLNNQFDSDDV